MALKSFGKKSTPASESVSESTPPSSGAKKDERIPMTVRLEKQQWRRIKELALDESASVQELAVRGLSRLLEEKGLDPL